MLRRMAILKMLVVERVARNKEEEEAMEEMGKDGGGEREEMEVML